MAITVTLKGVDITGYVDYRSIAITDTQEVTGDTMNMHIYSYNDAVVPTVGNEVIVTDGSTKEFGGILTTVSREIGEGNSLITYECAAIDYTHMLNRRHLNKVYPSKAVANGVGDSMLKDILTDLKAAADGDSAGGDSYYTDFYNNLSASYISVGPQIRQQVFSRILPAQALSTMAEGSGMIWWIDFDKRINFRNQAEITADFLPLVSGERALDIDSNIEDFFDLRLEDSLEGLGTKAIIKDAIIKSSATKTDRFVAGGDEASNGIVCRLAKRPFSELDITSVVRDRSGTNTTFTQALDDIARDADDWTEADPSTTAFVYVGRQGQTDSYVRITSHQIILGDIIKVTYNYSTSDEHENIDVTRVEAAADATGGDGYHEFVFSQGSEISVTGLEDLDEIAQTILDRKSKIIRRGSFGSLTKGWKAGQIFKLIWSKENIEEVMWVINVNKTILTPADDPNISDNIIQSTVQFANIPRGLRL